MDDRNAPRAVWIWGLLGLIPFLAPPMIGALFPDHASISARALIVYGAVILSFLGGARWGLAVGQTPVKPRVIALAMTPPLVGWALVLAPPHHARLQLLGLALALIAQGVWDDRARDLPTWYPRLRRVLTLGAGLGLLAGAALLHD